MPISDFFKKTISPEISPRAINPFSGPDTSTSNNQAQREGIEPISNPSSISVISNTDWFGPLQPLKPAAPKGTEPRKFEYQLGQNLIFTPRANDRTPYRVLKAMADADGLLRTVIETAKNLLVAVPFEIHSETRPNETDVLPYEQENLLTQTSRNYKHFLIVRLQIEIGVSS